MSPIQLEGRQRDHLSVGCVAVSNIEPVSGQYRLLFIFISAACRPTFSLADFCVENPVVGLFWGHGGWEQWTVAI